MGLVDKAEDTLLKRTVALKFLPPTRTADRDARQRYIREAQSASALDHPNICTVHEVGQTDDGQTYIVMASYEGETLEKKIEDRGLKIEDCINVALQVATGLARAHEAGIVHRDIKPANIFLTTRGEVKILDFGLARVAGQSMLTITGTTLGTAAYMSPEQARSGPVDARTDIWSLGVVCYEMVTGKRPFESDFDQALLHAILNQEPRPIDAIQPGIPAPLQQIIRKTLAKKPAERYQTADELIKDLKAITGGKETGEITLAGRLAGKQARRKILLRVGLGATVGGIAIVAYVVLSPVLQERALALNPRTILIIPFENQTGDSSLDNLQIAIQDQLITSLEQSRYFRVVTRQRIADLLRQMGRPGTNQVDHTLGLELCRREGTEVIVEGSFTKAGALFLTTAKLLDASTLQPVNTFTANGEGVESYLLTQIDNLEFSRYATERFPREKEFWEILGFSLSSRGLTDEAIAAYTKTLELDPRSTGALNMLAYEYNAKGEIEKAVQTLKRYMAAHPGNANPYDSMGDIYIYNGREAEAIDAYKQALAIKPDNVVSAMSIARISFNREDYSEALRWVDSSIVISPAPAMRANQMNAKAYYLFWLGRLKDAEGELRAAQQLMVRVGLRDEHPKVEQNVDPVEPWILCDRREVTKARNLLRSWWNSSRSFTLDTALTAARQIKLNFFLGLMDIGAGQLDSAESRLSLIDKLASPYKSADPKVGSVSFVKENYTELGGMLRGEMLLRRGRPGEALEAMPAARQPHYGASRPDVLRSGVSWQFRVVPVPQDPYPRAYVALGNLDSAIAAYERAISHEVEPFFPIIPRYHYRLAQVYEQAGMKQKAIAEYERFLKIWGKADPIYREPADARVRLARLKRAEG